MRNQTLRNCYDKVNILIRKNWAWEKYGEKNGSPVYLVHDDFNTSIKDFRNFVSQVSIERPYAEHRGFENMKDELENNEIPYLVYPVYHYFVSHGKFPTLDEATSEYLKLYCDKSGDEYQFKSVFNISGNPVFTESDIRSRMFRSYFSFVREIYLLFSLMEYDDIEVEYDFSVDTKDGLDIVTKCNGKTVYIASYVATKRSFYWKSHKNMFKHDDSYEGKSIIDAPAFRVGDNRNCKDLGQAFVYTDEEIQRIHDEIVNICSTAAAV